ncbi:hypothetical protein [Magnetospira sp. QH-2]|uniref:hypothetical protein n=1 Tax=Magnetospira sp. (strain QH-2) TaxID=1288970 RepID=UPI0003E810BF|nr:hypothetical protein [Magnetospira sp. QH-2]CCQ72054.1 conserved protein of unknown function [Magnetospira sp. QH-2]
MMSTAPIQRRAAEVTPGTLVQREADGPIFMKAERIGTDYIHHYLVQLHPRPAAEADRRIHYLDPDDLLLDLDQKPVLDPGPEGAEKTVQCGDLFTTAKGTFFKLIEDPKSQKMFAYVEAASGGFARRQERDVQAVHADWALDLG